MTHKHRAHRAARFRKNQVSDRDRGFVVLRDHDTGKPLTEGRGANGVGMGWAGGVQIGTQRLDMAHIA